PRDYDIDGNPVFKPTDFIIKAEDYGVPQKRHRVILLGIRQGLPAPLNVLEKQEPVSLSSVIDNLPSIRSGITKSYSHATMETDDEGRIKKKRHYRNLEDSFETWQRYLDTFNQQLDPVLEQRASAFSWPMTSGTEFNPTGNSSLD